MGPNVVGPLSGGLLKGWAPNVVAPKVVSLKVVALKVVLIPIGSVCDWGPLMFNEISFPIFFLLPFKRPPST